jgi:hypothetical protein
MNISFENGCPALAGAVQVGVVYRSDIFMRSGEPWLIDNSLANWII